jgi:hypothetical protein
VQRRQLESRAAAYAHLRGMLAIPAGLLFVLAALGNGQVGPFAGDVVWLACAGAIGIAYVVIARVYRQRYGRMTVSTRHQVRSAAAVVLGVAVVLGGSLLLRSRADWSLDLAVNPIAATFAIAMLAGYAIGDVLRPHHIAVYGSLLVAGALPVWHGEDPGNIGLVMCGACVIACGVLDHVAFVRTFRPALDA